MNDADIFDLIPAYALGALSEDERTQVEALLAKSSDARAELSSYTEMMIGMAALAPRQQAPAHLNADFRARLAKASSVEENRPSAVRRITPLRALIGLAALLVVVFGVYAAYRVIEANNRQQQINAIVNNANAQRVTLQPIDGSTGTVQVVTAPNEAKAVVVAELPALPADKQYQVWMIVDNTPRSMGVFSAGSSSGQYLLDVPVNPAQLNFVFGVTVEPAGGSPGPTTNPIFAAEVKQTGAIFPSVALAW